MNEQRLELELNFIRFQDILLPSLRIEDTCTWKMGIMIDEL